MIWKPTADEKKAIRGYAAKAEKCKPAQLHIEIGERYSLYDGYHDRDGPTVMSTNAMLVDSTPDWEESDLSQTWPWSDLKHGIELTLDGRAVVDFYVYKKARNYHRELLTNVQAHVALLDGKPVLWKITGTMATALIINESVALQLAGEPLGFDG
jgi:hypothetical protein